MADIKILEDDCDDGERGPRGHRGHRGHDGATGPTGPTGSSAGVQLKFSGIVPVLTLAQTTHLGDTGPAITGSEITLEYPVAQPGTLKDLAANIQPPVLVPVDGSIVLQLFLNGVAVPGFLLTWGPGETTGVKSIVTSALPVAREDLLDLQLTITNIVAVDSFVVTATIGSGA